MNRFTLRLLIIAGTLFVSACGEDNEKLLYGQWNASQITEEGQTLNVDLSEIQFNFRPDGSYEFQSTLNYREAGSFNLDNNVLYTLDTVNLESVEKTVQLVYLSEDTLRLIMNSSGKTRMLELFKPK